MSWIQLRWHLQSDQVAQAEKLLTDHGAVAVVLESLADEVVLEPRSGRHADLAVGAGQSIFPS